MHLFQIKLTELLKKNVEEETYLGMRLLETFERLSYHKQWERSLFRQWVLARLPNTSSIWLRNPLNFSTVLNLEIKSISCPDSKTCFSISLFISSLEIMTIQSLTRCFTRILMMDPPLYCKILSLLFWSWWMMGWNREWSLYLFSFPNLWKMVLEVKSICTSMQRM